MSLKYISESSLIKECLRKNTQAHEELYNKYSRKMFAICYRYTANYHTAEDILQESFIKIFDNLKSYKGEGSFEGWMKKIVINSALANFRKKKNNNISIDDDNTFEIAIEENPFNILSAQEIIGMIQSLPNGYREVLNLYIIDGYAHKEISEMLNISEANSKLRLNRARNILKNILSQSKNLSHESISK